MNINDTYSQQTYRFRTSEPKVKPTSRTAVRRTVRTLSVAKNYRKTAAMNAAAFFYAWSLLRSKCCGNDNKNYFLLHTRKCVTRTDMAERDHECPIYLTFNSPGAISSRNQYS